MAKENNNKSFVLRIDAATMDALEQWAADEFRSINGQLQWIIADALRRSGRLKKTRAASGGTAVSPDVPGGSVSPAVSGGDASPVGRAASPVVFPDAPGVSVPPAVSGGGASPVGRAASPAVSADARQPAAPGMEAPAPAPAQSVEPKIILSDNACPE